MNNIPEGLKKGHQERIDRAITLGIVPPEEGETIADWYSKNSNHSNGRPAEPARGRFTGDRFGEVRPRQRTILFVEATLLPATEMPLGEALGGEVK